MNEVKMGMTIEEAAECTGIGRNTMRKLVDWGKLPVLKVGRKTIIRRDTLERFMTVKGGWLPNLFRRIVNKAKDYLQNLIREHGMPPKPTLSINMEEFRIMRNLMIRVQDEARAIRSLQEKVPKLKEQLSEAKGIFKGKERKALTEQIQQTEKEISERLDKLPDILREDGYPDVQAFMAIYREAEAVVEQYNRGLVEWERQVKQKSRPPRPPERESVRNRLRQLQEQGRQQKPRKKSFDRDSR